MKFQEQKIKNFAGINELLTAQSNEFVECENVLNDVMQGELILNNIYKKEVEYTKYTNIDVTQLKTNHYVILEASKKYFVTIAQSTQQPTIANVRANGIFVGAITNYDKDKISIHQINQTLRISNGVTSWFLGERDVINGTTTTKQLYLEEQFNFDCKLEIVEGAQYELRKADTYSYIAVALLDDYQYIKIANITKKLAKDSSYLVRFAIKNTSKRITGFYLFEKGLDTPFYLKNKYLVKDYRYTLLEYNYYVPEDVSISEFTIAETKDLSFAIDTNSNMTNQTKEDVFNEIGALVSSAAGQPYEIDLEYNPTTTLGNVIIYDYTGENPSKYQDGIKYFLCEEDTQAKYKLFYNFKKDMKYEIRLDYTILLPVDKRYDPLPDNVTYTKQSWWYEKQDLEMAFTHNGIKYTAKSDSTNTFILTFGGNINYLEFKTDNDLQSEFSSLDGITVQRPIFVIINSAVIINLTTTITTTTTVTNNANEQNTVNSITGYQIIPETRYVTGWSKALLINNIVHYLNPVIERTDTDYQKNYIFRSEVSGSGAFMYDIAIEDPTQFLNLETFNGDEILTAEQLQNYDLLVFKKNSVLRVENTNRFAEVSNSHQITSKNSIHNDGGNIFFATQNGIFLTNGIEFTEISQKIKNSYLKLDRNNLILATDQFGRLHISDKKNKEYIFTKGGWIKSDKIFTFFYKFNLLYCMSNYQIFSSDIILDEANKAKRINILTAPFDLLMLDGVEHNMRVVIRSIWNNLEYQSGDAKIYLKIDGKPYKEVPLQENWRLFPIPNAKKVQIGIKGTFSEFRLKSLGFMWKPMLIGDRG